MVDLVAESNGEELCVLGGDFGGCVDGASLLVIVVVGILAWFCRW